MCVCVVRENAYLKGYLSLARRSTPAQHCHFTACCSFQGITCEQSEQFSSETSAEETVRKTEIPADSAQRSFFRND